MLQSVLSAVLLVLFVGCGAASRFPQPTIDLVVNNPSWQNQIVRVRPDRTTHDIERIRVASLNSDTTTLPARQVQNHPIVFHIRPIGSNSHWETQPVRYGVGNLNAHIELTIHNYLPLSWVAIFPNTDEYMLERYDHPALLMAKLDRIWPGERIERLWAETSDCVGLEATKDVRFFGVAGMLDGLSVYNGFYTEEPTHIYLKWSDLDDDSLIRHEILHHLLTENETDGDPGHVRDAWTECEAQPNA